MALVDGERVKKELGIKGATKTGKTRNATTYMAYEIVDAIDGNVIGNCEDCIHCQPETEDYTPWCTYWDNDTNPGDFCSNFTAAKKKITSEEYNRLAAKASRYGIRLE